MPLTVEKKLSGNPKDHGFVKRENNVRCLQPELHSFLFLSSFTSLLNFLSFVTSRLRIFSLLFTAANERKGYMIKGLAILLSCNNICSEGGERMNG